MLLAGCAGAQLDRCIDGDTCLFDGERVRLLGIDAPELGRAKCPSERRLAERARDRLLALLRGARRIELERAGTDRYGRTLARVRADEQDVGEQLIAEGLARSWRGHREGWCSPLDTPAARR